MEIDEALGTLQVQKAYMASMAKQLELIEHTIEEHRIAKETLEGLEGKEVGSETLVPLGGGTKAFVSLGDVTRVIVSIGLGVEMEMTMEKAIGHHSSLLNKLTKEKGNIQEKFKELEMQSSALSSAVEQAYARLMQQPKQPSGGQDLMS